MEGGPISAKGTLLKPGDCACSRSYPFGTKFYVPELGRTFTCVDRGGAINGNHLDIFETSQSAAERFGVKRLKVKIISREFVEKG